MSTTINSVMTEPNTASISTPATSYSTATGSNVGCATICVATLTAGATVASVIMASTATATAAIVIFSLLGITLGAISIASITACFDPSSTDVSAYFSNIIKHGGIAIVAMYELVAQKLVYALIEGLARGVGHRVERAIAGPDQVIQINGNSNRT